MTPQDQTAPAAVAPTVGQVLAAYLANFEARRAVSRWTFENAEADAFVAVVNAELGNRVESPVARSLAAEQIREHAGRAVADAPGLPANVAGYALSVAAHGALGGDTKPELIPRAVEVGTAPTSGSALWFWWGWRVRFLAVAARLVGDEQADHAEHELRLHAGQLAARCRQLVADPTDIGLCARLAWFVAAPGAGDVAAAAARELVDALLERHVGSAVPGADGAADRPTRTIELMWLVLAARAVGHDERAAELFDWVLAHRTDPARLLLRAESGEQARFETSPWIALVLASESGPDIATLEGRIDPQVPPLPEFEIEHVATTGSAITYDLALDGIRSSRVVDARELNLLASIALDRVYEGMVDEVGTARQHAHLLMALIALRERSADDFTAASIDQRIGASVEEILHSQLPSGGWAYGQSDVPSTVYRAEGKTTSEFPDRAYAIDAAVPGVALCQQFLRTGDLRCREAAVRVISFFEQSLRRVDWEGERVWLLYPDDERTPRMGSAVNYELWAGCFFAHVARVAEDQDLAERASRYAVEAVAYAASLADEHGNIAYGDYVREMRTPYAAWDAWLLAEIAQLTEDDGAAALARRIVCRIGELLLPNGAMPNVADYEQQIGDARRWTVHRHGIGPFPVRNRYQLYAAIAAAAAGSNADTGLRTLGYVLIDLWDEPFGSSGTGYNGDGRFTDVPSLRGEQPWILNALAVVARLGEFDYRVALGDVRTAEERVLLAVRRCWEGQRAREQTRGGLSPREAVGVLADRAIGCAALYRRTRAEQWLQEAAIAADALLESQNDGGWWPGMSGRPDLARTVIASVALLDAADATRDGRLPAAAASAAEWVVEAVVGGRPLESMELAALGRIGVLLTRVSDPPEEADDVAERCVAALLASQDRSGLWPADRRDRMPDERVIDVLGRLTDLAWGPLATPVVDRALRTGIDAVWKQLFAQNGRRFATPKRDRPMSTAWGIAYAAACCEGAARFADVSLLDRARVVLRYALHGDRTPDGDFRPHRGTEADASCSARCFSELACILERAPDVAAL